jgi:hypothetical protein
VGFCSSFVCCFKGRHLGATSFKTMVVEETDNTKETARGLITCRS